MRTVVDIAPSAMADFTAWREALDANPFVQRRLATAYTDVLFQLLVASSGLPASGRVDRSVTPHRYWHELTTGTWAEYTFADVVVFFSRRREIVIVRLVPLPPHQSVPITPPP